MAVTDPTSLAGARETILSGTAAGGRVALPLLAKIYILAVMIPIAFSLGPLFMTGLRAVLLVVSVPLFFMLLSGRFGKLVIPDVLFLAHLVWMAIAIGMTSPDMMVTNIGSAGMEFYGGYLVGRATIRTPGQFVALCRFVMIAVLCTLPLAIHEALTGRSIVIEMIRSTGLGSVKIAKAGERMGFDRAQVVFAHPIHYGLFASTAFALTFLGLKNILSSATRYIAAFGIGMCVFFSLSSGPLMAMVIQLGLIVWAAMFAGVERRWLMLTGFAVFCYVVVDLLSNRTPIEVFFSYATFSAHNAYWRGIIFTWGMKNIFGDAEAGIPSAMMFGIGFNDWVRPSFMNSGSIDNFWLLIGVRYGAVAVLLLMVGFFVGMWKVGQRDLGREGELFQLRRTWMILFMGYAFALATVHVWTSIYSFVFFMYGAGMWLLSVTPQDEAATPDPATLPPAPASRYTRFPVHAPRQAPRQAGVSRRDPSRAPSSSAPSPGRPGRAP